METNFSFSNRFNKVNIYRSAIYNNCKINSKIKKTYVNKLLIQLILNERLLLLI